MMALVQEKNGLSRRRIFSALVSAVIFSTSLVSFTQAQAEPTLLITGANRGIGFEFTRQYAERGWNIIATARRPDEAADLQDLRQEYPNITIEQLDVMDHASIDSLADKYAGSSIDILLNNAGIGGGGENQFFGRLNYDVFDDVMATNVIGPLKMAEAFIDHVRASEQKKIITVSSSQGSITQVRVGMLYFYRGSKTALNMVMTVLSHKLEPEGIIVGMVAPGATDTDFMKGVRIPLGKPEDRVRGMIGTIDNMNIENTGLFIEYNNEILPW